MKGFFVLLAVTSLVGCGGGGSGTTSPNNPNPNPPVNTTPPVGGISVSNDVFSPATKTVTVGTSVQWAWNSCTGGSDPYGGGQTCVSHSVTFDDGSASSPLQDQGTFTKTFNTPGTYTYHCQTHGTMGMTGTITVQ
jgi:plastocyanin